MTLLEAISSGRPRRCPSSMNPEVAEWHSEHRQYWVSDILKDWEIHPLEATITLEMFWSAAAEAFGLTRVGNGLSFYTWGGHNPPLSELQSMARRLGLLETSEEKK